LNEEKFTKARVMFKGSPSDARRDMRVAKQTGLYDRMTEKPSGKGRVFEITFKSEGQFRRFMSQFEVDLMEYPIKEGVEIDEATVDTSHYRSDHGRSPKQDETGGWSFSDKKFGKEFYMSPNKMPYKDAKVEAQKIAKKKGFSKIYLAASYHPEFTDGNVQLDEVTGETTVMAKGDRNQYERITRALTAAKKAGKIAGYEGAHYNFKTKVLTLIFDSKAHKPASQRRKVAKMIKDFGLEFSHSIEEGFASDAQRRAAFASGYKAKGKKKKEEEEGLFGDFPFPFRRRPYEPGSVPMYPPDDDPNNPFNPNPPGPDYSNPDLPRDVDPKLSGRRPIGKKRPAPGLGGGPGIRNTPDPLIITQDPMPPEGMPDPLPPFFYRDPDYKPYVYPDPDNPPSNPLGFPNSPAAFPPPTAFPPEEGEAVPPEDTPFGRFGEITGLHYVPDVIADRLAGDPMAILRARREAGTHAPPDLSDLRLSRDGHGIKRPFPDPDFPMNPSDRRYLARAEEEFTQSQLGRLKKEYDKINKINPESPTYKQLKDRIRDMDTKMLQQIYKANIKFMRGLAFNELSRRGKQPKV
jgi:hypothetical protein